MTLKWNTLILNLRKIVLFMKLLSSQKEDDVSSGINTLTYLQAGKKEHKPQTLPHNLLFSEEIN